MLLPGAQTKGLHLPLKSDPNYFGRSLKGKDDSTLPFTPQEAVDYCTKKCTLRQNTNDHVVLNIQLLHVFTKGNIWAHMKYLANRKVGDISWVEIGVSKMGCK